MLLLHPKINQRWIPPIGRVVYRSNNNANANAGVCRANCGNDSSNTNTNIGSRLGNSPKDKKTIGVQNRVRVPESVPRGMSLASSGFCRKGGKQLRRVEFGRPETVRRSQTRRIEGW